MTFLWATGIGAAAEGVSFTLLAKAICIKGYVGTQVQWNQATCQTDAFWSSILTLHAHNCDGIR